MSPKPLTKEEKDRLFATKTYILTHLNQQLPVSLLARHAFMGHRKLKEGFKELFGIDIAPFVLEARMQMAVFLLRHTDKSIKDIAIQVGYKNSGNFGRAFKKYFGSPASVIRD